MTEHRALVIPTLNGSQFYGFCLPCGWRVPLLTNKVRAQRAVDEHNGEGEAA